MSTTAASGSGTIVRMDAFLDEVPDLFRRLHEKERDTYEEILYSVRFPISGRLLSRMATFRGGPAAPSLTSDATVSLVSQALAVPTYPSAEILLPLKAIPNLTLPQATAILHFHHPAYPIYSEAAVKTLNRMGFPVAFAKELSADGVAVYEGYIAAIERLKTRIPFADVPETNCFLSCILEGALSAAS
ncbi:MAG: hypothetical protein ACYDDF_13805 [Thermoplasmatota archaeon]